MDGHLRLSAKERKTFLKTWTEEQPSVVAACLGRRFRRWQQPHRRRRWLASLSHRRQNATEPTWLGLSAHRVRTMANCETTGIFK
jgi:hypothetical protein